ncbi:IgGFc-binding protein-like [Saccostrea echinata]|uniref:IgGFc-binding protein-like n=1 Tax=Saccostrea echinata TaxID=191078 RepID=UPI002A803D35|nr:IgGFc-binding protein-like [Saccostrea echinata]
MERSKLFWHLILLVIYITDSYAGNSSIINNNSSPEESDLLKNVITVLEQFVKDHAIKMEIIEDKLDTMYEKLLHCGAKTSLHASLKSKNSTIRTRKYATTAAETTKPTPATMVTTSMTPSSSVSSTGSRGKEFLILFMRNYPYVSGSVTIYITTDNNTSVNISTSPNLRAKIKSATDRIMNVFSYSSITLPFNLTCEYLTIEAKAILLQTSELSTVSIFDSFYKISNDGTLIIPTEKLSTTYLVSSTKPYYSGSNDYYSQFAIAIAHEKTKVKIRFRMKSNTSISLLGGTYKDQDVFTVSLVKYETLQIRHTTDLTGTFITSSEPIAVFSGNRCQHLKLGACSHLVTQLPPTTEFDNKYIVPPFYGNSRTLIQVISESQSSVDVTIGNQESTWHMKEKEYRNIEVASDEITILESDNAILVTGFGMGSRSNDPYMTVIPGVHQYVDYYKIVVPDGYINNYICVIIPNKFTKYLQINGSSFDYYKTVHLSSAVLDTTFSIRVLEVNNGPVVVSTTNNAKFGLIVYGHRGYDGYGFAGNYVLS